MLSLVDCSGRACVARNDLISLLRLVVIFSFYTLGTCDKIVKIRVHTCIGRFQSIKTGVLLILSFITGDEIEFLPPMMFLNEYITGI